MDDSRCAITFLPQNRHAEVPVGTLLSDAARQAGIDAAVPCGGQGRCGRCTVRVQRGEVRSRSDAHLTPRQVAQGWVLSCQTEVRGPVTAFLIPEEVERTLPGAAKIEVQRRGRPPRDPVVSHHLLELSPPTLQDSASDLERVRRQLGTSSNVKNLDADLPAVRGLDRTLRDGDWRATAIVERALRGGRSRLVAVRPYDAAGTSLGAAVDIGTTTVAVALLDLRSGRLIDTATTFNRQISCGEDVISRIVHSQRGNGLRELQRLARETVNGLIDDLCARHDLDPTHIDDVVMAGNTTMTHLFLGLNARSIREEPYTPLATSFPAVQALDVGLKVNPGASVYCLPAVAAYVGGDITAGILSSGLYRRRDLALFMDVGTNGELVLGNADWLVACACSAGPAFEGAGVQSGMPAAPGAIEDVTINYNTLAPTLRVIGGGSPRGICGSGMIAALGEMFMTGIVDKAGRFTTATGRDRESGNGRIVETDHGPAYVLVHAAESASDEDIVLTEVDVANLISTKGAIYAGLAVMLRSLDIQASDIEAVLIGGGFGQHINVEKSILIGLLPDLPWDRFRFLGNTSALGASRVLLSRGARRQAEKIAAGVTYLELVADNSFMNEFTSTLFLPHTDLGGFPSVKDMLASLPSSGSGGSTAGEGGNPT